MSVTIQWCLTCGKPTFRCFCRVTQPAVDPGRIEEPERPQLHMPPAEACRVGHTNKNWKRPARRTREYVGVGRL